MFVCIIIVTDAASIAQHAAEPKGEGKPGPKDVKDDKPVPKKPEEDKGEKHVTPEPEDTDAGTEDKKITVRCFVVDGMILMVPSTVSSQALSDITHALLFFQLAADKEHNRSTDTAGWLNRFDSVAATLCLRSSGSSFSDFSIKSSNFVVADYAAQVMLKDAFFKSHVPTFKRIIAAFKKLPDANHARKLLHNSTYDSHSHSTVLSFGYFDQTNTLGLLMVRLDGVKEATTNSLIHSYKSKNVKTKRMVLNHYHFDPACYVQYRNDITTKLGAKKMSDDVAEVKF